MNPVQSQSPVAKELDPLQLQVSLQQPVAKALDPLQLQVKFPNCFHGLGKVKDVQVELHVVENAKPIAQKVRRLPYKLRNLIEEEIQRLLTADVIEKVTGPTPWLNPVVPVVKKNGKMRLCLDMRLTNKAIMRTNYSLPTLEDVILDMEGAKVISKLDLNEGYHQFELKEKSRELTAFSTETGAYQYKRLFFGISSAPEIFQYRVQQVIMNLPGVKNIMDDIIVFGRSEQEHDERLIKLLERLSEHNVTLNAEKCKFRTAEVKFMGHVLSTKGITTDPTRIELIKRMKAPTSATEIRSFLGLTGYCSRFIVNYAEKTEPLRLLTREKQKWSWGKDQEHAFQTLKDDLSRSTMLAYYHRDLDVIVTVDASPIGLGAILSQRQQDKSIRPVSMASRLLTDVERRYSQTEKEALAIVWACEHYRLYLLGTEFTIRTDHKPLETLYSTTSKPSARIERWVLRLQPFKYKVEYIKGIDNMADSLSRLTTFGSNESQDEEDAGVISIVNHALPEAVSKQALLLAVDSEYSTLRNALREGKKGKVDKPYQKVFNELTIIDDIIVKGDRILIPRTLQKQVLELAHQGHQGIVRTKERLRSKVWWPGMDSDAEQLVRQCSACQIGKDNCPV